MGRDCPNCEWPTEEHMTTTIHGTDAIPEYVRVDGIQVTRCPECKETLDSRENTTPGI